MTRTGLKPLLSTTLVDQAYEQLLERVASGQIAEGEKLVIDHIAKEFGVSLIPVREALARLLAENVVEYSRNKGYRVSPRPSMKEHSDIFTMRSILEAGAVRHGLQNLTAQKVEQLRDINAQISALRSRNGTDQYKEFIELNDRFHDVIIALPDNRYLRSAYKSLGYRATEALVMFHRGVPDLNENVLEHQAIIDAFERNDVEAAVAAVSGHIIGGFHRFSESGGDPALPEHWSFHQQAQG